ncbi:MULTISPECIES: hypothetical protein [Pseudomonas]|jgi:chitinase|uniref:hypothetical protein n=1 Tax=Pseudomonas TaxID=286 RepID=UPI000812567A|nr:MULTISPECIES: hypothetical protein [Pseudomonas]RZI21889.1 hypothetical protein EUX53_15860 [Pseudomonas orientalis]CRM62176.1 hypothetical protein [Pseudomonas sp. 28 E 9]
MLVNTNTQAVSTVQQIKRPDMDPANAAASALYSGALQGAQQGTAMPAAQKELDKAGDRIDEAFAKTRVQLQTTAPTSGARAEFTEYMSKSPAERIREQLLKEQGMTEEQVQALPQERQDAIASQVAERLKEQQQQQVAAKTAAPQTQALKDTLAAI